MNQKNKYYYIKKLHQSNKKLNINFLSRSLISVGGSHGESTHQEESTHQREHTCELSSLGTTQLTGNNVGVSYGERLQLFLGGYTVCTGASE